MHHILVSIRVCACVAILSALRNLQEKIRRLELEKGHAQLSLRTMGKDAPRTHLQSDKVTQRHLNGQTDTEKGEGGQSDCNQGECKHNIVIAHVTYISILYLILVSLCLIHSVDHPPGCCRVSLCDPGATAGSHEEDVAQCQGRQDQPAQTAG